MKARLLHKISGTVEFESPQILIESELNYAVETFKQNLMRNGSSLEKAGITDRHDPRVAFLDTQYRMQREIGDLVSDLFYDNELKTGTEPG